MSRRSFLVAVGMVLVLALSVGTALALLLHYEPGHYRRAARPPGERRKLLSEEFLRRISDMWSGAQEENPRPVSFTDEQVNSCLSEHFVRSGVAKTLLPEGISDPRVVFEPERIRFSFRYRSRFLHPVVSIRLRIWLPSTEKNVVALRLEELKAGLVPFSAQWLLELLSEVARQHGSEVNWYRHEGFPVALVRLQADRARPSLELHAVQFEQGKVTIQGRSREPRAAGPVPAPPDLVGGGM